MKSGGGNTSPFLQNLDIAGFRPRFFIARVSRECLEHGQKCLEQCLDAGEALRTAFRGLELCLEEIGIALPIPMVLLCLYVPIQTLGHQATTSA